MGEALELAVAAVAVAAVVWVADLASHLAESVCKTKELCTLRALRNGYPGYSRASRPHSRCFSRNTGSHSHSKPGSTYSSQNRKLYTTAAGSEPEVEVEEAGWDSWDKLPCTTMETGTAAGLPNECQHGSWVDMPRRLSPARSK